MATCPNCGRNLHLYNWKQKCPGCGVNLTIYNLQERLMDDADKAEVQNYHFQKKIDRLKGSFIGSPLAITRIVTTLLPVGALFLPIVNAQVNEPFAPLEKGGISALTIYNNIDGVTGALGDLFSGSLLPLGIALGSLILSILMVVVKFVLLILACSPKAKPRNITLNIIQLLTAIVPAILFIACPQDAVVGSVGIGGWLFIALLIVSAVIDILCLKQGIEIKHKQCYVGGIPIEEYFEMLDKGMSKEEIREEQYARLTVLQEEKEAKLKADEEAKAKAEAEKTAAENN